MRRKTAAAVEWTPREIAGLKVWLDATQETGLANNDPVAQWTDWSGNGNHATQGTAGTRPVFKTEQIYGRAAVDFAGGKRLDFSGAGLNVLRNVPGATFIAVAQTTNDVNDYLIDFNTNASGVARVRMRNHSSVTQFQYNTRRLDADGEYTGYPGGKIPAVPMFQGLRVDYAGRVIRTYSNWRTQDASSPSWTAGNTSDTASNKAAVGLSYAKIGEWLLWERALSDAEVALVYEYLHAKWGLPVFSTGFEEGGADGTGFPAITSTWPSGVTVIGDWSYNPRVEGTAFSGKGVRFPTSVEGGGSNNSLYRVQQGWTNAALVSGGVRTRGKSSWYVKIPANGGVQYRTSGASEYWCSCLWQMDDMASLTSLVAFNTQSELCLLNRVSRVADWSSLTPAATLDITGYEGAGWHKVEVEWSIGASGFIKVTWDGAVTVQWDGDTSLLESGIKMYLMSPGGITASNSDLTCFGGMDEVRVWRAE